MIFNPYDIHLTTAEAASSASALPLAIPQLQDNALLVVLILGFLVVDMLACRAKGVMRHEVAWITDTPRNARTFELLVVIYPWLKPLLLVQLFLFFGLTVFCLFDEAPAQHLLHLDWATLGNVGLCVSIFLVWFLFQWFLFNWFCYLFGIVEKRIIMNRSYQAVFIVLSPFAMLLFVGLIAGWISPEMSLVLLFELFILSQITFIFNGFKIFYKGFGTLCLIIVYLCTLIVAPLMVIWAKFVTLQV